MQAKANSKLSAMMERNNAWVEENIFILPPKPEPKQKPKKVVIPKVSYFESKGFSFSTQLILNEPKRASGAEQSGLKAGDRLLQINGVKVESTAEADAYMDKSSNKEFNLLFDRNDFQFFITLKR
jgi:membrane-associated protease RseP (regulator of RpoE activity)